MSNTGNIGSNVIQPDSLNTRTAKSLPKNDDKELKKACHQFEEIFIRIVLKEAHINRGLFNEKSNQLYGDMATESLAKAMSEAGGLGLAETLYRQLSNDNTVQAPVNEVTTIQREGSE